MIPPVSLPFTEGTQSAWAGATRSAPQTAMMLAAKIFRIADSISLRPILRLAADGGKNGGGGRATYGPSVAALHLTAREREGTVAAAGSVRLFCRISHA